MIPRRHALRIAALSLLGAGPALAQDPPAVSPAPAAKAVAAEVTPPTLKEDFPALFPEQAIREHYFESVTVVLILDIDANGGVRGVTVETARGHGFDEAASTAASKLQFTPAERAGTPIASRIKFQYTFSPPASRLIGRVTDHDTDKPVRGIALTVKGADGRTQSPVLGADGAWQVDALPPGPVHISASALGYESAEVDDNLAPGEETNLVLRLSTTKPPPKADVQAQGKEDEPQEIVVRGERPPREVTKRTLTKDEIDHIPGTNGDALRSIQSLPGVARPPPFSGALIVRGSAPLDTLIFVEGVDVPLIYHFGGLSSVVPTEMIDKIDFYPSNYSSVYGRATGGMVNVGLRDPRADRVHGLAQVDLIDARVMAEGPIFNTGWKFMIGGRRSTLDLWIGPVLRSADIGVTTAPRYYDYQLMLQKDVTKSSSLRLSFFGSDDKLEILNASPNASSPDFGGSIGAHTSFWRAQTRYQNRVTDNTEVKLMAAVGQDSVDIGVGSNFLTVSRTLYSSRGELTQKLARGVQANVGFDLIYYPYDLLARSPVPARGCARRRSARRCPGEPPPRLTLSAGVLCGVGACTLARRPHRAGSSSRLFEREPDLGSFASHQRATGPQAWLPAIDRQRRCWAVLSTAHDSSGRSHVGEFPAQVQPCGALRPGLRARNHPTDRPIYRPILQVARSLGRAWGRQRWRRPRLRRRVAAQIQIGRALLRLARVHLVAQRAARHAKRSAAPLPIRPDPHSDGPR